MQDDGKGLRRWLAGAVVVDDVPEGVVVAGIPARVIKDVADTASEKIEVVDILRRL